jgi:hypothetical protein
MNIPEKKKLLKAHLDIEEYINNRLVRGEDSSSLRRLISTWALTERIFRELGYYNL